MSKQHGGGGKACLQMCASSDTTTYRHLALPLRSASCKIDARVPEREREREREREKAETMHGFHSMGIDRLRTAVYMHPCTCVLCFCTRVVHYSVHCLRNELWPSEALVEQSVTHSGSQRGHDTIQQSTKPENGLSQAPSRSSTAPGKQKQSIGCAPTAGFTNSRGVLAQLLRELQRQVFRCTVLRRLTGGMPQ